MYFKKRHSQTMATVFNSKICTTLSWMFDFCDSAIKHISHFELLVSTQMPADYIFHWKSQPLWESKKKSKRIRNAFSEGWIGCATSIYQTRLRHIEFSQWNQFNQFLIYYIHSIGTLEIQRRIVSFAISFRNRNKRRFSIIC